MVIDANLLLYAAHSGTEQHRRASAWLTERLNGSTRVGLPWQSLAAFLRISTHARAFERPLSPAAAWELVREWLARRAGGRSGQDGVGVAGDARLPHEPVRGNLVPDALLAALAIEHGVTLYSADTDFARFRDLRWENPLG